jgi:putative secretion ATPase (PEP-CTERM system associated)
MYERFFQLRERPFALSPDPEYLYPSRVHQEALDYLRYGLESQAGFVVITGEIGSGKTTLLQTLLRNLDSQTTVGRIVNTMLEPRELLESIMLDFGLPAEGRSKPTLLRDLAQFLVDQRLAGRLVLMVIDEAQNLSLAALEELRMLSNMETEKSKLLQIVLVGQPNLRDKLGAPELEQLRQRITVSYHLPPLDAEETLHYINHRLRRAAIGAPLEFPADATVLIHARSRGVPRVINVICDATLVFAYAEERRQIDAALVREVLQELETTGVLAAADAQAAAAASTRTAAPAGVAPAPVAAATEPPAADAAATGRVLDARNWPPAPARQPADDRRQAVLDAREERINQREQELAEQRRVLAEEYRLLRARHQATAAPAGAAVATTGRAHVNAPAPRTPAARPDGLWGWVKRVMLGISHEGVVDGSAR